MLALRDIITATFENGVDMPVLSDYGTPAFWQDFPDGSPLQTAMNAAWSEAAEGWIQQAILNNPWTQTNATNQTWFYDPTQTDIPDGTAAQQVEWTAFPGRIIYYLSTAPGGPYNYSMTDMLSLADTGFDTHGNSFPPIPSNHCPEPDWSGPMNPYGPYGPRGWMDEYCEWSVARDTNGNIVRVDFAIENPEYWYMLWHFSPETVRARYEETLNYDAPPERQISVELEELYLYDSNGDPVVDPSTGLPAYNPLNTWNSGTTAVRTGQNFSGGAMHLTSTPNTLQTELNIAGASTVQRNIGNSDPQALICCGQYGQNFRNSDPHIGQGVSQLVSGIPGITPANRICLANPLGLYGQMPDTSGWTFATGVDAPPGVNAGDVFQVVRGWTSLIDPVTGQPFPSVGGGDGAFILHAICQIPSAWLEYNPSLTLADIAIDANIPSIQWGGQIVQQMQVGLYARPLAQTVPPPAFACVGDPTPPLPQPLQLFYANLWDAYYAQLEPNPVQSSPTESTAIPLASNTTFTAARLPAGTSDEFALTYTPTGNPGLPSVQFSTLDGTAVDTSIVVTVNGSVPATYSVPGNSYPNANAVLYLTIATSSETAAGMHGVQIVDAGMQPPSTPLFMPALLAVD